MWQELEALNSQIIEARKTIRERDRILDLMAAIDNDLIKKRRDLSILVTNLKYEKQDVRNLESLSPAALYYKILGIHQEILEKEVQEYFEVKLNVEQCELAIGSKENYQKELEAQLIALAKCDEHYAQLKQIQDEILLNLNDHKRHHLQKLINDIALRQALLKETNEAIEAGHVVSFGLSEIIKTIYEGKDITGGWSKHFSQDPISKAIASTLTLQPKLDRFQEELADITAQFWPPPSLKAPTDLTVNSTLYILSDRLFGMKYTEPDKIKIWLNYLKSLQNKTLTKITALQSKLKRVELETNQLEKEKSRLTDKILQEYTVHS